MTPEEIRTLAEAIFTPANLNVLTVGLLGRRLTDAARATIDDAFHINAYCMRLKHAYELLLAGRTARATRGRSNHAAAIESHIESEISA